jgi:hypothetical protein
MGDEAGIVAIGGGLSLHNILKAKTGAMARGKVTVIQAHDFLEWSLAAT